MRLYGLITLTVVSAVVTGCAQQAQPLDLKSERDALRAADLAWAETAADGDSDSFASFLAADGVILPPNEASVSGAAAAGEWFSELLSMPGVSVSWKPATVEVAASGDLGYTVGTYELDMEGPDGSPMNDHGKYVTVWKKDASGEWRVAQDIFNSDVPLAAGDDMSVESRD